MFFSSFKHKYDIIAILSKHIKFKLFIKTFFLSFERFEKYFPKSINKYINI